MPESRITLPVKPCCCRQPRRHNSRRASNFSFCDTRGWFSAYACVRVCACALRVRVRSIPSYVLWIATQYNVVSERCNWFRFRKTVDVRPWMPRGAKDNRIVLFFVLEFQKQPRSISFNVPPPPSSNITCQGSAIGFVLGRPWMPRNAKDDGNSLFSSEFQQQPRRTVSTSLSLLAPPPHALNPSCCSPPPAPFPIPPPRPFLHDPPHLSNIGRHAEEPKSFVRRDRLAAMEGPAQERWKADKIFETKAEFNEDGSPKDKFMVTFPYPYMNGRLHLGHAYSMSKVRSSDTCFKLNLP